MKKIAIIDYEGGNLASVAHAVETLNFKASVVKSPQELQGVTHLIFPGVGAAGATMNALTREGWVEFFQNELKQKDLFCLGICIGIQVLFESSEEDDTQTLGLIKGKVVKFPEDSGIKVPHIGWNKVNFKSDHHPILKGFDSSDFFYFVNSYHIVPENPEIVLGHTQYGPIQFSSLIQSGQWTASQFHLEKSGPSGLKMLNNFLNQS